VSAWRDDDIWHDLLLAVVLAPIDWMFVSASKFRVFSGPEIAGRAIHTAEG
jgi:hypothetical protein